MSHNHFKHTDNITYPVRLNRYMYLTGVCSRRQADKFIENGQVSVNGKQAVLGLKIDRDDVVTYSDKINHHQKSYVYYIFNKPIDIVSHNPQPGEKSIEDIFKPADGPVYPVGRLDKASRGLMFLTNDGRIIDKMLNPKYDHEKEYEVTVDKPVSNLLLKHFNKGVNIEGYKTKPAETTQIDDHKIKVVLTEGKKHQIRRMCAALGFQVTDLVRVRIMNIELRDLQPGQARKLSSEEIEGLFNQISN